MRHIPGVSLHWPAETKAQLLRYSGSEKVALWRDAHVNVNGWRDIGYHYIIARDRYGNWKEYGGRSDALPGAHSGTNWGNRHLGIMVAYGMDETLPDSALNVLAQLIADLSKKYGFKINSTTVKGHRDFIATQCPGDSLYGRLPGIIKVANKLKSNKAPVPMEPEREAPEDQLFPAKLKIIRNGQTIEVDAMLVNSQLFVHAPKLGPTQWDGATKTGILNLDKDE